MVKDAVTIIKARIALACERFGRSPLSVTLVGVSKGRPLLDIQEAIKVGITDIGENRVQEALLKYNEFSRYGQTGIHPNQSAPYPKGRESALSLRDGLVRLSGLRWHMIGHLQTNKVKDAVRIFDLIQSVDSLRLAEAIEKEAVKIDKVQDVLIEVKTSPEATKFGAEPHEVARLLEGVRRLKNIRVSGLMTIAPLVDAPEKARVYFRRLKEVFDASNACCPGSCQLRELSMGMTDDFEVAIEEGSTMIRIGRALFQQ